MLAPQSSRPHHGAAMIIRSQRVVTPDGVRPADVEIADGVIVDVREVSARADVDIGELVLLPGVVDAHVHINEPGRTHWEGFESATRAAAAGGTTTVVDMPLNSIPSTTSVDALQRKIAATEGKLRCDVGYWGGVVPGNTDELRALWEVGVLGFKAFLHPSGVDEFQSVGERELREAMPVLAELGAPLLAHCELPGPIEEVASIWDCADPTDYSTWLDSRPPRAELEAIEFLTSLAAEYGTRVHVVHLATEEALPKLREIRRKNSGVTVETCAHYLTFAAEEIPRGATAYKCAPPIRLRATREALWAALGAGDLDFVTTDHSPSPPDVKCLESGRFDQAWGGIASLQLLLSALWTGARRRGHSLTELANWLSTAPARFAGIADRKGEIRAGKDADLVVFDPDAQFTVDAATLHHRHPVTPYDGLTLHGVVHTTYLRGEPSYDRDQFGAARGSSLVRRSEQK